MDFIKKIFGKKQESIKSYEDFWNWFLSNEKKFYNIVKSNDNIEENFLNQLIIKLNEFKEGLFFLTGMHNDSTVELIFTVEGKIKNIIFVDELVKAAPKINGWMFTPLKPAFEENAGIKMGTYRFNKDNISFYANDNSDFPDEIDITIIHNDLNESNVEIVTNGTYIFMDNFLGELTFLTTIDNINVIGKDDVSKELIPIEKLKDYLLWRQKEFIENYEDVLYNDKDESYSVLEAELLDGKKLLAVVNTDVMKWNAKASHPWILDVEIKYEGEKGKGMPDDATYNFLDEIEEDILHELKSFVGNIYLGRQTLDNTRNIYIACKDFRSPSKILYAIEKKYSHKINLSYEIYKDKYWRSVSKFMDKE